MLLDEQNPRLPQSAGALGQRNIISELVTHDSVYELAKDISSQGFFPTEILLGVRDGDQVVVIEGNRRLAALKLLVNPELAPQTHLEKFRRLSENVTPSVIAKVQVTLAPSRDAATPILLSRHTAQQIQSWKRPMQARFYRQLLERGLTPNDLVQSYGISLGQIQDWIRADAVYRLACSLDFPSDIKSKVQNNREFPLSTLERLVESKPIRDFLQLKADPKEVLVSTSKPQAFLKAFRRIVTDVVTGTIDSRLANDAGDIADYLKNLKDVRPTGKRAQNFQFEITCLRPSGHRRLSVLVFLYRERRGGHRVLFQEDLSVFAMTHELAKSSMNYGGYTSTSIQTLRRFCCGYF